MCLVARGDRQLGEGLRQSVVQNLLQVGLAVGEQLEELSLEGFEDARGLRLVLRQVRREGREGRSDAAQLQPQAAAADRQTGAQPRPVPARRRLQGCCQVG